MGWKIKVNKKGLIDMYSTVTDEWVYTDLTENGFIDVYVEEEKDSLVRSAKSMLERAKRRAGQKRS